MSVSSLPEWKQLLLERKRREEEERERIEKEEEKKFANMPAWKRGIIQRRKAKQDYLGEKDKDVCLLQVDFRSPSDCLSETDSFVTVSLGSELSFIPDPGLWLDADSKPGSQVSVETIVPVHENPFIRTQSARRKGRDKEVGNESEVKEGEKDKSSSKGQDEEMRRGRDIELKIERFRDLSEGREKERSIDRSQRRERESSRERLEKDKSQWKESVKDVFREREFLKGKKEEDENETDPPSDSFSPEVPCMRTIRADNIIIIEQDRTSSNDRRGRWREVERERPEEDYQGKRGMKMDLRHILAGGGSVTEIRASEVLIIQPSASPEERNPVGGGGGGGGEKGPGREDGEMKCSLDGRWDSVSRELRTDMSWLRAKDKARPWGQATVIKDDSLDDSVFVDRGGRVSQLLSKFGEHPKPPSRSKSSDNFIHPGRRKYSGDDDDQQSDEKRADGRDMLLKNVPKRSYSFSDRVVCGRENGLDDNGKRRERIHSDKSESLSVDIAGLGTETTATIKPRCARLRKQRDGLLKNESEFSMQHRSEGMKVETVDTRAMEQANDADGDEGFTAASVKNTEGISFARRVPIRQDGKTRVELRKLTREKSLERELSVEKHTEVRESNEKVSDCQREEEFQGTIPPETMQKSYKVAAASAEQAGPCYAADNPYRQESAFTECSSLLCAVTDRARDLHRVQEWSGTGPHGPYLVHSVLSQHTEELISKIEKIGDTTVYSNEKGERVYKSAYEMTKESQQEAQTYSDIEVENLIRVATLRSPKRIAPMGIPQSPLEIQIPRSVFYVAEEVTERKKAVGQSDEGKDWEGGKGVERRDSWRIGKPLSRVESLREQIRQRELQKLRQREAQDGGGSEGADMNDTSEDRFDERGTEMEWEAEAHMRKRPVESERVQEDTAVQTSMTSFDVTREVGVLKTCPQLPVSVPHSEAVREEEVTVSRYTTAASEVVSDSQTSDDEDNPLKHVEGELKSHTGKREDTEEERAEEEEEKELSEQEEDYTSPLDPVESLSPLLPHPNSLTAMSRIYNLEAVGSRSGLCLRERTVDIPSVQLVKVKNLKSNAQQGDSKAFSGEEMCGVQKIQQQIEQFKLREQEALRSCTSPNDHLKDRETKGQQSPRGVFKHQVKDDVKAQEKDQETSGSNRKVSPHRVCSPTSQLKPSNQTITVNPSLLRSPSPDNILKPLDCAPTPTSSPCPPSPAQSRSVSPSPTPSPTQFSIRSASGGKVKRGATMTISPRKAAGGEVVTGSTKGSPVAELVPEKTSSQQAQITSAVAEPGKKKYPKVEEIEVIGGYQNLEKSCLIKSRGNPKRGKVCFDEDQLEQVCEYPSETSMLASTPFPHDPWRSDRPQAEEAQEEEAEVEGEAILSKGTSTVGIEKGRGLRVDESCPR